jgi:hypothetical protein
MWINEWSGNYFCEIQQFSKLPLADAFQCFDKISLYYLKHACNLRKFSNKISLNLLSLDKYEWIHGLIYFSTWFALTHLTRGFWTRTTCQTAGFTAQPFDMWFSCCKLRLTQSRCFSSEETERDGIRNKYTSDYQAHSITQVFWVSCE